MPSSRTGESLTASLLIPANSLSKEMSTKESVVVYQPTELSHYLADDEIRERALLFCGDGTAMTPEILRRHAHVVNGHPEVVCTFRSSQSTSDRDDDVQSLTDGRDVARQMIFSGGDLDAAMSLVLVRVSALEASSSPPPRDDIVAWFSFVFRLLTRGSAWCDEVDSYTRVTEAESVVWWRLWPSVIGEADRLGLLSEPRDWSRAATGLTRRAAALLRSAPSAVDGLMPEEAVEKLAQVWRTFDQKPSTAEIQLNLRVIVLTWHEMEMASRPSVAAAQKIVASASRLVVPGGDWQNDSEFQRLVNESTNPVLALLSVEALDVLDRSQLQDIISSNLRNERGEIATPQGPEVRIFPPSYFAHPSDQIMTVNSLRTVDNTTTFHDWLPRPARRSKTKPIERFIIVAPTYTERHGGSIALHRLCDRLNALGYEAYLHPVGDFTTTHPGWDTPVRDDRGLGDAVVVYPEIITGNFLSQARVVRWLLNRPGWFTGKDMGEGVNDLVVSFSHQVNREYPIVQVPLINPTVFFPKDTPGEGKLLWIGKGELPASFDRSDTTLITNKWPSTKSSLASLLRRADVLYTCDWLTSIIEESVMCATPVVLVGDQSWNREDVLLRPGVNFEDQFDPTSAHEQVTSYFPWYLEQLRDVDTHVEEFVQLVNDHFERVES